MKEVVEMKVKNVTDKNEFLKAMEKGLFGIELVEDQDGKKVYKISDKRANRLDYILHKFENNYVIEYDGCDATFTVYCTMKNNYFDITEAKQNGKTYKSERYLKKFNHVCMFANCFVAFGLCD